MSINLLNWRHKKILHCFKKSIIRLVIYVIFFVLVILFFQINLFREIKLAQKNSALLQNKMQNVFISPNITANNELLNKINLYFPKRKKIIATNKKTARILNVIADYIPRSITLQSLTLSAQQLILSGVSGNLSDITLFNTMLYQHNVGKNDATPNIHNDTHDSSQLFFTEEINR